MSDLASLIVNKLININATVATCESCTGGMIASTIVDVSGASACFNEGYITYSNDAKIHLVNVDEDILKKYGSVSEQTASQMAIGARKKANATFGISSTGIAGPTGGTVEKPVGLIYIACSFLDQVIVKELRLNGNRLDNRNKTVIEALSLLSSCIDLYKELQ